MRQTKIAEEKFRQLWLGAGFREIPAEEVRPKADRSVFLTGAAIVPLKPYLDRPDNGGVFAVQPCLKARALNALADIASPLVWLSRFKQAAAILGRNHKDLLSSTVINYFDSLGLRPVTDLSFSLAEADEPLFAPLLDRLPKHAINLSPERDRFSWQYGIEGLTCRCLVIGCDISAATRDGIADIIHVQRGSDELGYEFCVGLETTACAAAGGSSLFQFTSANTLVGDGSELQCKILDCLMAVIALARGGVEFGHSNETWVMKRYVRALATLCEAASLETTALVTLAEELERLEFGDILVAGEVPALLERASRARQVQKREERVHLNRSARKQ